MAVEGDKGKKNNKVLKYWLTNTITIWLWTLT